MKITLAGVPGSGKSTLRSALAERYQLTVKGTGDFMRQKAHSHGYQDITRFLVEYVSQHPEVDREVDEDQWRYGKENDQFVLDAHLGFHFVPDSIKIFLHCDEVIAARRILEAKRNSEEAVTLDDSIGALKKRVQTMQRNFKNLYGVDIYDHGNYDCVIDTSRRSPQDAYEQVVRYIERALREQ